MTGDVEALERPLTFRCEGSEMLGLLHPAETPSGRGVLLIVGGPQYRVGCHRQFVLLGRALAAAGIPVLRFDYRGMGDSEGELRGFERIESDIRAAMDAFCRAVPDLKEVVLWGLCDAASATAFYASRDPRVAGAVLVNPWVQTGAGQARTELRHYYVARIREAAFWRKLIALRWNPLVTLVSIARAARAIGIRNDGQGNRAQLPKRLQLGLEAFDGRVLLILSGQDLTAREFEDAVAASQAWSAWRNSSEVTERRLEEADHTFSCAVWRDQVATWTIEWLGTW